MEVAPLLRFEGLSFGYDRPVLADINFTVARGEVLVILGPSGCGKSSLLRLASGLVRPNQGQVLFQNAPPQPGQGMAMAFQSYRLLPWKTVLQNIAFALPHLSKPDRIARARETLALVGLSRFAEMYPRALSGGMQQRVALARALAVKPELLLLDEPFAALDAQARELMQFELLRLVGASGGPGVIFITHSVDEALVLGARILVLSPRPGRILQAFTPPFATDTAAPRGTTDPRDHPAYPALRRQIWELMRQSLVSDPNSDFYHRALGPTD